MTDISVSSFWHADILDSFEVRSVKKVLCVVLVLLLMLTTAGVTFFLTSEWMMDQYEVEINSDAVKYKMERVTALLDTYYIEEYDKAVVEAAAALALYDLILGNTQTNRRK